MDRPDLSSFASRDWASRVLTPKDRRALPIGIKETHGCVTGADSLLTADASTVHLEYPLGGDKPVLILDMGPSSPGGYPAFRVKNSTGTPVVRVSYADWYAHISDAQFGETGDFRRGTCRYLGVELPVPPANPYRYELYTVTEPGLYAFPLVQGQQRWVRIQLDTPGSSVDIECFQLVGVPDASPHDGFFLCSDEDITRLWYASTYTTQMASIQNSHAWDIVEGWLAPRGLAKCNEVGLSADGEHWAEFDFSFDFKIVRNPGPVSAVGWVFRAQDPDNCYAFQVDLDGRFHAKLRHEGAYRYLKPVSTLASLGEERLVDGQLHNLRLVARGTRFETYLDGRLVDVTEDDTYRQGRVGFCQPLDKWALVGRVRVSTPSGASLLADDFDDDSGNGRGLDKWDFRRTPPFVADGAKRDRLPWIGDLDWAGRNAYYAFRDTKPMLESLRLFALNQTPEGYVWATCYPENTKRPAIGEYGYYQSDLFSAWFIPTVADYVLFTGDREFAEEIYGSVKLDADYLWSYVERDGLFFQRYDTSKGLWSHELEDLGKFGYNNILTCDAMAEAAFIAEFIGLQGDAGELRARASIMKEAILRDLWDEGQGCFVGELGSTEPCFMANSLALAIHFLDDARAARAAEYLRKSEFAHGKIVSLTIRGHYDYRQDDLAVARLRKPGARVNWLDALNDPLGPGTTTECMFYPPGHSPGSNWGDCSHPDTAMAHILTGCMLGVQPTAPGFVKYNAVPHTHGLSWAKGVVPTPGGGEIRFGWQEEDGSFEAVLESPAGLEVTVGVPTTERPFAVEVNGEIVYTSEGGFAPDVRGHRDDRYVYLEGLAAGKYAISRA